MYFIKESSRQNGVARAEAIQKEVRSMYPTIENIKEIAAKGQYKRVPVCREVYADRYTPVEVMRTLRKASRHCYLLESASQTGQKSGDVILFLDMSRPWRLPARTEQ